MSTSVYYATFKVGDMLSDVEGRRGLHFRYTDEWLLTRDAFPISTAIPLEDNVFSPEIVEPWFANLLPEEGNLTAVARAIGAAEGDIETLLEALGGDTAGALSFGVPNDRNEYSYSHIIDYYRDRQGRSFATAEEALNFHISELGARPFLIDDDGVRTSLAGGQEKTVLAVLEGGDPVLGLDNANASTLAVPLSGAPSTVIIKPDNPRLPGIVENEAYCLELARRIGLPAVDYAILRGDGDRLSLAVKRYDRRPSERGLTRIHQEDFAQALGFAPRQKYERGAGGGPSLVDILSVGARLTQPRDRLTLLDYVIYNILVANTDAHAKNYSLILERGGEVRLAPLYDVSCVVPWEHVPVNQYHAQNLGGRKRKPADMQQRYWESLAEEAGSSSRETLRRVRDLVDAMVAAKEDAVAAVSAYDGVVESVVRSFADAIELVATRVEGRL